MDPTAPSPPGGPAGPNLLINGDFASDSLSSWGTVGAFVSQVAAGVLEFRAGGTDPAPVVLQATGATLADDEILTATFLLDNSSPTRHRTKVLIHDLDFTDAPSCVFWIPPNQPLQPYTMRVFTTKAWTNATIAVYPSTGSADPWTLLDNVTLQRPPSAAPAGTMCLEPCSSVRPTLEETITQPGQPAGAITALSLSPAWMRTADGWETTRTDGTPSVLPWAEIIDLTQATSARLTFESWLSTLRARGEVQVSLDGIEWLTVAQVASTDTWQPTDVDLSAFIGHVLELRFVLDGAPPTVEDPDVWRVRDLRMELFDSAAPVGQPSGPGVELPQPRAPRALARQTRRSSGPRGGAPGAPPRERDASRPVSRCA